MLLRVFVLLTLLFAATTPSLAETRQIAKVSASQLQSACDKAGGTFGSDADMGGDHYGCVKRNCDGKGGDCIITCGHDGCAGTTPRQLSGNQTLISLLQNGDLVLHDLDPTPTGSLSSPIEGGAAAPAAPADPGPGLL
jgi:hypothetical protein